VSSAFISGKVLVLLPDDPIFPCLYGEKIPFPNWNFDCKILRSGSALVRGSLLTSGA
jgi:hypothetical protein